MPIVEIKASLPIEPRTMSRMISEMRNLGGKTLNCPPGNIWVLFQQFQSEFHFGGIALPEDTSARLPTAIVSVRANEGRTSKEKENFVLEIERAIALGLSIPASKIWIHYQEMKPQDIWMNGAFGH